LSAGEESRRPSVRISGGGPDKANLIVFEGTLREPDPSEWLTPLIDEVHEQSIAERVKELVLDLRRLSYANAAGWKCFVYWVKRMNQDRRARYRLSILCSHEHQWQEVGMPALRVFGGDRLVIKFFDGDGTTRTK
jgi:hypothetical protein